MLIKLVIKNSPIKKSWDQILFLSRDLILFMSKQNLSPNFSVTVNLTF